MAEIRFNYGDKFTQTTDTNTGIGSTIPAGKLDVAGNTKVGSLRVSGIATLSSYQGFVNTKLTTNTEDLIVEAGQSGSVSGEVVVSTGQTISVSTGATTGQGGIQSLKVYETFMPPVGGTADRPTDVKPGMVYYNKDFKTIEFWDGNFWKQVDNTTRSGRAVFIGSSGDEGEKTSEFVNISSLGNGVAFGEFANNFASGGRGYHGGCASATRGIFGGGWQPGAAYNNIDYFTIESAGNSIDFGNLSVSKGELDWCSNSTRGITAGGEIVPFANTNTMDYIQIATIGDSLDFGDITTARRDGGMIASPISGFLMGGVASTYSDIISKITIASTGSEIEFGNLTNQNYPASSRAGNATRGFVMGGVGGPGNTTLLTIDQFVFTTGGSSSIFGDLMIGRRNAAGACNSVRALCAGGGNPSAHNAISHITMSTSGDAQDFGDLNVVRANHTGLSNAHGGLGGF